MPSRRLPPDDDLIHRLLAGDAAAYTQVVTAYHGLMVHLVKAIVGERWPMKSRWRPGSPS